MGDQDDGSLLKELEKNYCPPLDSALFTAIVSDYDLGNPAEVQLLRDTLDALKLSAWEQEDLPFDPSGTSGLNPLNGTDADGILSEPSESQNDTVRSRETDINSDFSSISIDDQGLRKHSKGHALRYTIGNDGSIRLSGADEEDKIGYLTEMFPSVDRFTIQHTLRKSEGDIDRSMDVLLNVAFFDEQPPNEDDGKVVVPKGIDGFEDRLNGETGTNKNRKRRPKNKNGRNQGLSSPVSPNSELAMQDENRPMNKWDAGQRDVEFIHSRTSPILKKEAVHSAYHANGASLPITIRSLAVAHAPDERLIHEDPVMAAQVAELMQEFPSITPTIFGGLLTITRNSTSAAGELATAMVTCPAVSSVSQIIQFVTPPPPCDLDDETPKRPTARSRVTRSYENARNTAGAHFEAGAEAFNKATTAYRRGKSDRLMGGAAAYYSAVGRDHLERAKQESAAAADALVNSQSTANMLDLHGVSVQDAVRIASDRVSEWWDSLGDVKYIRGGNAVPSSYRIVTGLGRHSHDGTSRLGPAVGKMLAREGWKVEVGEGVLTVVGVMRRR